LASTTIDQEISVVRRKVTAVTKWFYERKQAHVELEP